MIKDLIKLANHLDDKGFAKEANYLDGIIKEAGDPLSDPAMEMPSLQREEVDPASVLNRALGGMDELKHRIDSHKSTINAIYENNTFEHNRIIHALHGFASKAEEVELRIKYAMELMNMYIAEGRGKN